MVKGFGEASVSRKKRSKSSLLRPALDCAQLQEQLAKHFEDLEDPRGSSRCASSIHEYCNDRLTRYNWRSKRMGGYRNLWSKS